MAHIGDRGGTGLGFIPLIAAAVAAGATVYSAKAGASSSSSAAKKQLEAAQLNLRAARIEASASKKRWLYLSIAGVVAVVGAAWALRRRRK